MRRRLASTMRAALLCGGFLYGSGPAAAQTPPSGTPTDGIARGEALAVKNCGACHAVGRTGDSPDPKAPVLRLLSQRYPLDNLQEALAEGTMVGHEGPSMPEFEFEPEQIDDLIAYLTSISTPSPPAGAPQ